MKHIFQNKIFIIGLILIVVFVVLILVIYQIGRTYNQGLSNFTPDQQQELKLTKTNKIKKITLKDDQNNCIEVTPDGAVRVYEDCGDSLSQAGRSQDQSAIFRLFKKISETDLNKYKQKKNPTDYEITIQTDDGEVTIYVPNNPSDPGGEIIPIIKGIGGSISSPSPYASSMSSPNSSGYIFVSPQASTQSFNSPYPSPSTVNEMKPFVCDFIESGGKKKPYNVSNIICSTNPSPAP